MSSILDISSMYDTYSSTIGSASASSVESSINSINDESTDDELMEACKSFESYFVQKIIEEAKKTVDSEEDEGEYMQYFGDMLNQTYADTISENGDLGLAQQLYDSVKGTYSL